MSYSKGRTVYKSLEAPVFVLVLAEAVSRIFDVEHDTCVTGAVALYGMFCGIANFIKNRKK